ncbi:hypothetical protein CO007_00130 [Candidatus Roizmanbacteria bacterium CG_4_8_14_3_um_filter_36_10]|uniref:Uncharacterized protein n=1 Tax=Candidatus Roizmanbacteria bacterium CG_4_8_14_3_um_filter_36_10 TaxID=1974834 RepID=A0A2M8GP30_9BACT|nr:MAG: hypothetical protein CO007_00130 [Candidatus Roizmanbacteria bacterium CG_4_8_14_3_um_filter_36_10]
MNNSIFLRIAGFDFKVNFIQTEKSYSREQFKQKFIDKYFGFIKKTVKDNPDFTIDIINTLDVETIYKKKKRAFFMLTFLLKGENTVQTFYHVSLVQLSMILNKVLQVLLIKNKGFLMHASAVAIGSSMAFIFTGPSGAGKSTIMKLLNSRYKPLADDSVIIKKENDKYYLYQTPMIEKVSWIKKNDKKYKIAKICFLKKEKNFFINRVDDKSYILPKLVEQLFAGKQKSKNEYLGIMRFVKEFDQFHILSFAKNKENLLNFFEKLPND